MGQNIYDVDKKSESSFETFCLQIFYNKCLSPINFNSIVIITMHFG